MENKRKMMIFLMVACLGIMNIFSYTQAAAPRLSRSSLVLLKGQAAAVKVKNTDKKVKWSSSDIDVATVNKGKVKAIKKGIAVITAKVGGQSLSCKVRVVNKYSLKIVNKYLDKFLKKYYDDWQYVFFENETMEYNGNYIFNIRYQGGDQANILAGTLQVYPLTGKAFFEPINGASEKVAWKIF